jgi:hypothetical protein
LLLNKAICYILSRQTQKSNDLLSPLQEPNSENKIYATKTNWHFPVLHVINLFHFGAGDYNKHAKSKTGIPA